MASSGSHTQLGSLQPELVAHILSKLNVPDLHRAALVSRLFRSCASSPALCRKRVVHISCDDAASMERCRQRLESFQHWLNAHGQHLRSLRFEFRGPQLPGKLQLLAACIAMSGQIGSSNEALAVRCEQDPFTTGASHHLTALRRLCLFSGHILLPIDLEALERCTQLALYGRRCQVSRATRLPPNLGELMLGSRQGGNLPSQLTELTALHTLELRGDWRGASCLSKIASLRHLHITGPGLVPPELSTLTGLESLLVEYDTHSGPLWDFAGTNERRLEDVCKQLTGLTSLALSMPRTCAPDAVVRLTKLRRAYFGMRMVWDVGEVPPGPWLASLESLAASASCLLSSAGVLASATQLTALTLVDVQGRNSDGEEDEPSSYGEMHSDVAAFFAWTQGHPRLRRLTVLGGRQNSIDLDLFRGSLALKAAHPDIEVTSHPALRDPAFAAEFHYCGFDDLLPGWRAGIALSQPYQYEGA